MQDIDTTYSHYRPTSLAGIVPVHKNQKFDFNMPWDDCFMPLSPGYTIIQNAVYNCVRVGCETVWVVIDDDSQPLIRTVLGDFWKDEENVEYFENKYKLIPIYYVPASVWDRNVRDSYGFTALYGCYIAWKICGRISHSLRPRRYFISWPFSVFAWPQSARTDIRRNKKDVIFTYQNKSIKDGLQLSFTIDWEQALKLMKIIRYDYNIDVDWFGNTLPREDQFNACWASLEEVFDEFDITDYKSIEVEKYYPIDSWENYKIYLSDNSNFIERPREQILKHREFRGIGS